MTYACARSPNEHSRRRCAAWVSARRSPRMLDVAYGTGVLPKQALEQARAIEAYGIDGSADTLMQARHTKRIPASECRASSGGRWPDGDTTLHARKLPSGTCTKALHAMPDLLGTLVEWRRLLAPGGQLPLEDFARRGLPFPWRPFEWLVQRVIGFALCDSVRRSSCNLEVHGECAE
jgi:ubiquinone/menaquinone biosynthesis C-methylase UbiE